MVGPREALDPFEAERDAPGANITSFGEAIWWAVVTLATVGYGDTYPVTVPGRAVNVSPSTAVVLP